MTFALILIAALAGLCFVVGHLGALRRQASGSKCQRSYIRNRGVPIWVRCWWCKGTCLLPGRNWVAQGWVEPHCWHCIDGYVDDSEILDPI